MSQNPKNNPFITLPYGSIYLPGVSSSNVPPSFSTQRASQRPGAYPTMGTPFAQSRESAGTNGDFFSQPLQYRPSAPIAIPRPITSPSSPYHMPSSFPGPNTYQTPNLYAILPHYSTPTNPYQISNVPGARTPIYYQPEQGPQFTTGRGMPMPCQLVQPGKSPLSPTYYCCGRPCDNLGGDGGEESNNTNRQDDTEWCRLQNQSRSDEDFRQAALLRASSPEHVMFFEDSRTSRQHQDAGISSLRAPAVRASRRKIEMSQEEGESANRAEATSTTSKAEFTQKSAIERSPQAQERSRESSQAVSHDLPARLRGGGPQSQNTSTTSAERCARPTRRQLRRARRARGANSEAAQQAAINTPATTAQLPHRRTLQLSRQHRLYDDVRQMRINPEDLANVAYINYVRAHRRDITPVHLQRLNIPFRWCQQNSHWLVIEINLTQELLADLLYYTALHYSRPLENVGGHQDDPIEIDSNSDSPEVDDTTQESPEADLLWRRATGPTSGSGMRGGALSSPSASDSTALLEGNSDAFRSESSFQELIEEVQEGLREVRALVRQIQQHEKARQGVCYRGRSPGDLRHHEPVASLSKTPEVPSLPGRGQESSQRGRSGGRDLDELGQVASQGYQQSHETPAKKSTLQSRRQPHASGAQAHLRELDRLRERYEARQAQKKQQQQGSGGGGYRVPPDGISGSPVDEQNENKIWNIVEFYAIPVGGQLHVRREPGDIFAWSVTDENGMELSCGEEYRPNASRDDARDVDTAGWRAPGDGSDGDDERHWSSEEERRKRRRERRKRGE